MHKPNPDTIARLLNQAGEHLKEALRHPTAGHVDMAAPHVDAAMHCIHQAFQETIGGAAYARPEPSPQPAAPAADRPHVFAVRIVDEGEVAGDTCRAVTQFMEPRQPPAPSDERTVVVGGRRLRVVLRGPCYLDAPIADCGVRAVVVDDDVAAPKAEPAAPAAKVAGWVVRGERDGFVTHTVDADGHCDDERKPYVWRRRGEAVRQANQWRESDARYGLRWTVTVLPVDAAGNVLEERAAPAPDVVAQCCAAESEPAPREPDGWVVVSPARHGFSVWLAETHEEDAERNARSQAAALGPGYTTHPFWLDTPPLPGVAWEAARAGEEAATLRAEVERLRAALRAIAATCGGGIHETATTEFHCAVADEVRLVVERLTRERYEARFGGVCHALGCMVEAYELGGASASKLAEMLGWRVGELHGSGLQAVANMIFEAATELPQALALARQCRDVALGERERIADFLNRDRSTVRALPAPTLPEVP